MKTIALLLAAALGPAAPSDYAKRPPPKIPAPDRLEQAAGYGSGQLDPYRGVLSDAELRSLFEASQAVMKSPAAAAAKRAGALIAADLRKFSDGAAPFTLEDTLFSYTLPNDPLILLGAAKSYDGSVTALPRLTRDAFAAKADKPGQGPSGPGDDDTWIYGNPEQVCPGSLSTALPAHGSAFSELEKLPPPSGIDVHQMNLLVSIENNPDPVLHSSDEAASRGPEGTVDTAKLGADLGADAAAEAAPGLATDGGAGGKASLPPHPDVFDEVRKHEMPLSDFLAEAQSAASAYNLETPSRRLLKELTTLAAALGDLKRTCLKGGGRWTEARGAENSAGIELFACRNTDGRPVGLGARLATEGDDAVGITATYDDVTTGLGVSFMVSLETEKAVLSGHKAQEPFGPELTWDLDGHAVALNFHAPDTRREAEFDVFEWHTNGALKLLGHRIGGRPAGDERTWYASGALAGEVNYDAKGTMITYREWYENHRPAEDTPLVNGKMHGQRRWWHENGTPAGEITYDQGEPTGQMTLWYDNAQKGTALTYKNGRLDGNVAWWYDDGSPLYSGRFKDGQADGAHKLFLAGGNVLSERSFKNGKPDGVWSAYNKDGKPLRDVAFKNGEKTGKSLLRYQNGTPFLEMGWKDGALDGPMNSYFPSGQMAATCLYDKDDLVSFTRWYPTGETALEGKVLDQQKGSVEFTGLRRDGSAAIECTMAQFDLERCKLFDAGGQEIAQPPPEQITKHLKQADSSKGPKLTWQPERCGGFKVSMNYADIINNRSGQIVAEFDTNHDCPAPTMSESLTCIMNLSGAEIKPGACIVNGYYGAVDIDSEELVH